MCAGIGDTHNPWPFRRMLLCFPFFYDLLRSNRVRFGGTRIERCKHSTIVLKIHYKVVLAHSLERIIQ